MTAASVSISPDSLTSDDFAKRTDRIINDHVLASMALGLIPLPLVDLAGLTLIQANMIQSLSELGGTKCTLGEARKWILAFAGGSSSVFVGTSLVKSLFKVVPVIGPLLGGLSSSASGGAVTYALGQLFRKHCQQGGSPTEEPSSDLRSQFEEAVAQGSSRVTELSEAKARTEQEIEVVADQLSKLEGIGPKIEYLLHAAEIHTFAQLATTPVSRIREILNEAGRRYNIADPTTWPQQAELAAKGAWDELEALTQLLKGGREKKD